MGRFLKGHKLRVGLKHSDVTKEKIRLAHLGKKFSLERRKQLSEAQKERWRSFSFSNEAKEKIRKAMKNRIVSNETRKKMSEFQFTRKGEKAANWKGGITKSKNFYNRMWKIRKRTNGGCHTLGEWENLKIQYNLTCPDCKRKEPSISLTEDHIVPLSKGGSNNIENIQPLCVSCNSKKHTKVIFYEKTM